jgi:hypothetical protein
MSNGKKSKKAKTSKSGKSAAAVRTEDDFQSDLVTPLQRCAADQADRQATLAEALNRWAIVDIVRLERVDAGGRCGWAMWKFTS